MNSFFSGLTFSLIAVPALAYTVWALLVLRDMRWLRKDAQATHLHIASAVRIGALIHEVQRERGLSAGYVSSKDPSRFAAMQQQRDGVDDKVRSILTEEAQAASAIGSLSISTEIEAERRRLNDLRNKVTDGKLDGFLVVGGYSTVITRLLVLVSDLVRSSTHGRTSNLGLAYVYLITGKEQAGQERAVGNAALASGKTIAQTSLRRIRDLAGSQEFYFRFTRNLSSSSISSQLKTAEAEGPSADFVHIRTALLAGETEGLPAQAWFTAATARIDAIKRVEDIVAKTLLEVGPAKARSAKQHIWVTAGLVAAICLLAGLFVLAIGASII